MFRTNELLHCERAVVIGGSIAGLCAARVLADSFDRVTLYERDELPDQPIDRSAIPQGQHVHLLMARGAHELEGLFPGLLDDMAAADMPVLHNEPAEIHFTASGHVLSTGRGGRDGFTAYLPSRALLEWHVRTRVQALPRVEIVRGDINEPEFDPAAGRVTGVVLDGGVSVAADLVVDASGRGSRLPTWMQQWGFDQPRVDAVKVGVSYASLRVRIPDALMSEKMVVVGAAHDQPLGMGMLFHEDGAWTIINNDALPATLKKYAELTAAGVISGFRWNSHLELPVLTSADTAPSKPAARSNSSACPAAASSPANSSTLWPRMPRNSESSASTVMMPGISS